MTAIRSLLIVGIFLVLPTRADATQVLSMSLSEMVDAADVAIWGTVTATTATRPSEAPGRIHTVIRVQVKELVKSDKQTRASHSVEFVVPGGKIGRIGQWIPGTPRFSVGEEVVLLLSRQLQTSRLLIVGFSQGQYRVKRRGNTIAPNAVSDRKGIRLLKRDRSGRLTPANEDAAVDKRPLTNLLAFIRKRAVRQQ